MTKLLSCSEIKELDSKTTENKNITSLDLMSDAVQAGVRQIQGTINGLGERCGNANLMSLIPTFFLKKDFSEKFEINIKREKGAQKN